MKQITQFFRVIFILIGYISIGQGLNDGPYVFIEANGLIKKSIIDGKIVSEALLLTAYDTIYTPEVSVFSGVEEIAALSDIHGQYDLAVEILINNKIIDQELNWSFGKGHLVIVGDIFDRGPKVNEMLWLIYKLEQQAEDKGGHLHFLLGNHEYMVLHKDLRYVHDKYLEVGTLLNLEYDEMYDKSTVLGRWLRSKSTILRLNNHVFVHGGISQDFLSVIGFNIESINASMRASIDISKAELKSTNFYTNYYGTTGPIWYRGYFTDNLEDAVIDDVLSITNSEHIVVGHCSFDEVIRVFDGKIYGVDSSIKKGLYGELLFIENGVYYRGTKDGTRKAFE
ncbi:metallophosphoesterase [Psychroserpens ponticola]|uniref:Metallophosphoesterase n=1 Tax=Psychroserpens ponticola TaxID=2932268 RepID=A0ABY7RWX2_9FLAO|nr:metallophosphoesterase [Psychroserpens ponticola]WCO00736.1 metallophosphoesterase [Psychroserpens ponticola]